MKHVINDKKKEAIIKAIVKLLADYQEINSVYLFGSFLNGRSFSDIDIGVLTQRPSSYPLELELELEQKIENIINLQIDVRILNKAPISFSQNVIRTGKIIIDNDPDLRTDFEGIVLKKYFDFNLFRRRYLKEVMNAPI